MLLNALHTNRLLLRRWTERDSGDLVEGLCALNVSQWLAFVPHPYTVQDAFSWISYCQNQTNSLNLEFAIELKSETKVIGGVSLNKIDHLPGTAGGGIWLHEAYHGRGFGKEALSEKIRFAFEDLDLRRLDNGYFEGNRASEAMLLSMGYRHEGI